MMRITCLCVRKLQSLSELSKSLLTSYGSHPKSHRIVQTHPNLQKKRKSCDSDENSLPPTAEPLTEKSVSKIDDPPNSKDTAESEVRVLLSPSPTSKTAKPKKQQSSSKDSVVEKVGDESTKMNTLKFVAPFPPKVILTTSVSESDKRELRQSISKINGTIVDKLKPGVTHLVSYCYCSFTLTLKSDMNVSALIFPSHHQD
eukprot:TRINITY_DN3692_c0_g1_i4.p1 TRINITY_DN3692_c0_g1~~TRINITY_DN3692_c0_g1_i4.p1  ORF type:complete len:201 (-),score=38.12 TRINITY_DN3692_c0_g1_i4:175-777(-)